MFPVMRAHSCITLRVVLSLVVLMLLASCGKTYDEVKKQRVKDVNNSDAITIAIIWDKYGADSLFFEGITQAADEVNGRGGVFGRKVKLKFFYAKNDADELMLAKKVAHDTSFAAVIGHRSSTNAIPATVTYEYCGLLYVSPSASNKNLTDHKFEYTFRCIPSDKQASKRIAALMMSHGHRKIAMIDDRTIYGKGIADDVMGSLADLNLEPVVRRYYTAGMTDFKPLCAELRHHDFDAIFLGGMLPRAASLIREARQMGIFQPVYGGDALDSPELEKIAGNAARGTVAVTYFDPGRDSPVTRAFVSNFIKRYRKFPDTNAALFYDSLMLITEAMKLSNSAEPLVVASHMRFLTNYQGATGNFSFNLQGDPVHKEIYFKYLSQTGFTYLDAPAEGWKGYGVIIDRW